MNWFVVLNGKYWTDISPKIFQQHHVNPDWACLLCDAFDAGANSSMCEITQRKAKILVPCSAVLAAVQLGGISAADFGFIPSEQPK